VSGHPIGCSSHGSVGSGYWVGGFGAIAQHSMLIKDVCQSFQVWKGFSFDNGFADHVFDCCAVASVESSKTLSVLDWIIIVPLRVA